MSRFSMRAALAALAVCLLWTDVYAQEAGKHALLVGVSNYPHLDARYHLKGPANDVVLMRDCLMKEFGFAADRILVLSEDEGKKRSERYPERANIEREFKRLAEAAKAGDQVVILMGGHGSQQPEKENAKDPEPDGLDEIFLPRDVKSWDGDQGKVPNAIIDDEIGEWIAAIRAKQAYVWIIFDSCHSGTMIRGVAETTRQIRDDVLGIPKEAIRKAETRAAKRRPEGTRGGPGPGEPQRSDLTKAGGVVALYACQSTEVTVERELPLQSEEAKPYGLLTFTLVQTLTQAKRNSGKVPTYRELIQIVNSRYAAMGRTSPTPQMEGPAEDRQRDVLGVATWPGKNSILLTGSDGAWKINAGTLHGITPGSILAVRPLADQKDPEKVVGHVRVEKTKMTTAEVTPCEFGTLRINAALPDEGRCELVHVDFGSNRLAVAVAQTDELGKPHAKERISDVQKALSAIAKSKQSPIWVTDDVGASDWVVVPAKPGAILVPATQLVQDKKAEAIAFGPFSWDEDLADVLATRLGRILRAENLRKLAGNVAVESTRGKGDAGVSVEVSLTRFADPGNSKGAKAPLDADKIRLHHQDAVGMSIKNPNRFPIAVTVLYIDSNFGIEAYFPVDGEENVIPAGSVLPIPPITVDGSKTFGQENLVVIAMKAKPKENQDFTFLAQASIEKAKRSGPSSPLDSLLETAVFGAGNTRGISRRAVDDFTFRLIPWHLSPDVRKGKE
jgi:hypothetical protein